MLRALMSVRWPALPMALVLATGCTGVIGGPEEGAGHSDATSPDAEQRAIDGDLQAQNPELYAIALQYFPGQDLAPAGKRVFRLTRTQLDLTTRALLPEHYSASAVSLIPRDPLQTNYEYSANLGFSAANFTPYINWVQQMVDSVRAAPETVVDCAAGDASPSCLEQAALTFVTRAFRGVTSEAQLDRYVNFFASSMTEVGLANATADLVDVTLTSPSYVFRDEVQTDADGVLFPAQLLQNITYTLADSPPEAVGLAAAALDTPAPSAEQVTTAIDQVLASSEARAKLLRFFAAWLEVREPNEFDIATSVFPEFTAEVAAAAVEETRAFLDRQLSTAAPKLKDVTESTQSFVSDALAFIYDAQKPPGTTLVDLDPAQRFGIFSLPAVIASHSGPTTTRLVKRGVFFTRKVMCLPLGVPQDVDTTIPANLDGTERQKIESLTTPAKCAGCHAYINPFGFMQENYDAIGRFRTEDNGLPIDASISVDFLDEGTLTTNSPVDALKGFTRSKRFQQCFARQLFRFYTGRNEEPSDDPVLRQMFFEFANEDEQDIVGLLRVLAGSSTFSRRSEAP